MTSSTPASTAPRIPMSWQDYERLSPEEFGPDDDADLDAGPARLRLRPGDLLG